MNAKSRAPEAPDAGSLPLDSLKSSLGSFAKAVGGRAVDKVTDKAGSLSKRLTDYAEGSSDPEVAAAGKGAKDLAEGGSPAKAAMKAASTGLKEKVKGALGGGGGGGDGKAFKFNNIVEAIDVGAPVDVVYDAWTEYDQWPDFMKKLERAELDPDEGKVSFKGQVFWSHREWESTITHQVPGKRIVWESTGAKGYLNGTVTFHALADDLTRIVLVVEYHPQGFVEKTGNIWRALNRRLRLELKFFVRHVMTDVVLRPDELEGFHAEIEEEEIVRTHDEVLDEEAQATDEGDESESDEAEPGDEDATDEEDAPEDEDEPEDEYEEEEPEEEPEDEYEDEYEEEEPEEEPEEASSSSR